MPRSAPSSPTIIDLARRLKLSPGAVSQALNGTVSTIRVSADTVRRVRKMADKLGYRPNRMARTLRTGRSGMVGILTRQGFSPLTPLHLYYARVNAERVGLVPFVYEISSTLPNAESQALQFMLDVKVDALVILGWRNSLESLRKVGIPTAVIGKLKSREVPSYFVDQTGGYRLAAEHLLDQGYNRLCLMTDEGKSTYRIAGCRAMESAVKAAKKQRRPASWILHTVKTEFDGFMIRDAPHIHGIFATGYVGMKSLIAAGSLPEAIIFRGDAWAQGALRACKEAGIRVPEDLAVVGFNDDPSSSAGILSLTSVGQPLPELHEAAFNDIRQALDGKTIPSDHYVEFPCSLMIRESSMKPRRPKN